MSYAWDQCAHCAKLGSALGLNALGLCPECAADDTVVARKEEELLQTASLASMSDEETPAVCAHCGRPASYSCDYCGAPVCSQDARSVDIDAAGNLLDVM